MLKHFIDDTITFAVAFTMVMPWTAIDLTQNATHAAGTVVYQSGLVNVAVAADMTIPEGLPEQDLSDTVRSFIEDVRIRVGTGRN